ncbi:hypothetical protein N0039_31620, partial [Pseudomonas aeruginosa]|nr:hypothetical protein [Pseudomonas aeruginosa]
MRLIGLALGLLLGALAQAGEAPGEALYRQHCQASRVSAVYTAPPRHSFVVALK